MHQDQAYLFTTSNLHLANFGGGLETNFEFWFFSSMSRGLVSSILEFLGSV